MCFKEIIPTKWNYSVRLWSPQQKAPFRVDVSLSSRTLERRGGALAASTTLPT